MLILSYCLFESVNITKNAYTDKYSYSGYGIGFDSRWIFSVRNFDWGKNVVIFGLDMSSSVHINNKGKDILILGKGQTQGLDCTTFTAEAEYFINCSIYQRKFCISIHFNGSNSFLFVNATKIYQFKAKDFEIKNIPCV